MQQKALYLLNSSAYDQIYGPGERAEIAALVDVFAPPQTSESIRSDPAVLWEAEIILSGWGMPPVDAEFLAQAPQLRAIFYGAGSVRGFVTEALWQRVVVVTSSYAANAVPVAEYTLAATLFSLKHGWGFLQAIKRDGKFPPRTAVPGAYGSTVGIVSLGMVGRLVVERLRPFDLRLIAYDPFVTPAEAATLGVELVTLEHLFRVADVASLHTPWLPETVGMITGTHLASMKAGATFINTARGAVVREDEMIAVLQRRPDLQAVLDVTYPEPPLPGSPLFSLPNVVLTPHIAGSRDAECRRMGRYAVDELQRYLAGEPLHWQISRERAAVLA
ncbi:MAG TPA: hydroxyacid dehydrogenase [Chloroflexota bacterium]